MKRRRREFAGCVRLNEGTMSHVPQPTLMRTTADGSSSKPTTVEVAPSAEPVADSEDCDICAQVLTTLGTFAAVRAVKAYRLRVELTPPVPQLPCLDHEAMLHEGIAPHAAAYVEDHESGELYELVLTPSKRRIEIDVASTLHEHSQAGRARLLERLREQFPEFTYRVNKVSWLRGDRRVARACRAQVTLREVLAGSDFDRIARALDRLRTVGALMEKESRVASWSVRTVTGPFLAVMGFFVYQGLGELAPELGEGAVTLLQAVLVGAAGALFLYFGLKAVHLTEMANRVWKRAAEFGLILAERRRLGDRETATSPAGEQDTKERQVDHV